MDDTATRRALGARVRRARDTRGWTQLDLAEAVGVTLRTIGSWERQGPPRNKIVLLEHALNIHLVDGDQSLAAAGWSSELNNVVVDLSDRGSDPAVALAPLEALIYALIDRVARLEWEIARRTQDEELLVKIGGVR